MGSWQARTGATLTVIGRSLGQQSTSATKVYARVGDDTVRTSMVRAVEAMREAAKGQDKGKVANIEEARPRRAKAAR